jgi:Fe-S-cluster-containing hydrogenase component 2
MVKLDKEKCDACGLCMKMCPCSNIHEDKDGYRFGNVIACYV